MNELKSTYTHKNTDELMQYISESLLDLGFAPNLKGFTYAKEAIYIYMAKYHENVKKQRCIIIHCTKVLSYCFKCKSYNQKINRINVVKQQVKHPP